MLWKYRTPGIPDELFERTEEVPITKEDVRALAISKLRLMKGHQVLDIGCGSGSMTVEICMQVDGGKVYAIDQDQKAVELTKKNLIKFGVNAEVIHSKAQDFLPTVSGLDAVMVGGTLGDTANIIRHAVGSLKKGGRIVLDTILIETMYHALDVIRSLNLDEVDITQVTIAKARRVSTGTMMLARNPVLIISATKA